MQMLPQDESAGSIFLPNTGKALRPVDSRTSTIPPALSTADKHVDLAMMLSTLTLEYVGKVQSRGKDTSVPICVSTPY